MKHRALLTILIISNSLLCNNEIPESTQRRIAALSDQKKEQKSEDNKEIDLIKYVAALYVQLGIYEHVNKRLVKYLFEKSGVAADAKNYEKLAATVSLNLATYIGINKYIEPRLPMQFLAQRCVIKTAGEVLSNQVLLLGTAALKPEILALKDKSYRQLLIDRQFTAFVGYGVIDYACSVISAKFS